MVRAGDLDFLRLATGNPADQEHEPVELRLGQRVGAFLLDRVLRGQHEERRVERETCPTTVTLLLLHRFEHGRLGLGRGAVDLVGQHDVGEHRARGRTGTRAGRPAPFLQDVGAGDVHRHQVGRELDAAELQRHRLGQLADQQRLGQPRHAHQQRVAAGEQADRQPLDHVVLADDDLAQFRRELAVDLAQFVDGIDVIFGQG